MNHQRAGAGGAKEAKAKEVKAEAKAAEAAARMRALAETARVNVGAALGAEAAAGRRTAT